MERVEKSEKIPDFFLSVDGTRVVLQQVPAESGVSFRIVDGMVREIDEPGQEELMILADDVDTLNPAGDMEQSGLGTEVAEKDGVRVNLQEATVTGPDPDTVKRVLEEMELGYSNPYDV